MQDLVNSLVSYRVDRLLPSEFRFEPRQLGFLVKHHFVCERVVVGNDPGRRTAILLELVVILEHQHNQRDFRFVHFNATQSGVADRAWQHLFQDPAGVAGKRLGGVIKEQVMPSAQRFETRQRTFLEIRFELLNGCWLEGPFSRSCLVERSGHQLAVRKHNQVILTDVNLDRGDHRPSLLVQSRYAGKLWRAGYSWWNVETIAAQIEWSVRWLSKNGVVRLK